MPSAVFPAPPAKLVLRVRRVIWAGRVVRRPRPGSTVPRQNSCQFVREPELSGACRPHQVCAPSKLVLRVAVGSLAGPSGSPARRLAVPARALPGSSTVPVWLDSVFTVRGPPRPHPSRFASRKVIWAGRACRPARVVRQGRSLPGRSPAPRQGCPPCPPGSPAKLLLRVTVWSRLSAVRFFQHRPPSSLFCECEESFGLAGSSAGPVQARPSKCVVDRPRAPPARVVRRPRQGGLPSSFCECQSCVESVVCRPRQGRPPVPGRVARQGPFASARTPPRQGRPPSFLKDVLAPPGFSRWEIRVPNFPVVPHG